MTTPPESPDAPAGAATSSAPPDIWDWLGLASLILFLSLGLAVVLKVDLLSHADLPDSASATYAVGVGGPVVFILAVFSVMRLGTKGWPRRWLNRSRLYAPLTLALYWVTAIALTFCLAASFADDERKTTWIFPAFELLVFSAIVFLFVTGAKKFATRRRTKDPL